MGHVKYLLKRFFFLPPLPTVLIALPSFALMIYVLSAGLQNSIISYVTYIASAYAAIVVATGFVNILHTIQKSIYNHPLMRKMLSNPIGNRLMKDVYFRTELSMYQGVLINFMYAAIKLGCGIYYRSLWFIVLAGYYFLLVVMRFFLLRHMNKNVLGQNLVMELHRYRLCGIMLLFMNQALTVIVILIIHYNQGYEYPGLLIYLMAFYTFYAVTIAIINLLKYRKRGSPVMSAAKVINLTTALVSILALETAMLAQFGAADGPAFRLIMTRICGAGVCTIVFVMAIVMIVRSTKELRKIVYML